MKYIFLFSITLLLFSCQPKATKEQSDQYDSCRKTILANKELFLASGVTKERKDSLQDYLNDIEKNNLDQLVSKLDVEPEQVNLLVYSVCEKAESIKSVRTIQDAILKTDDALKMLDSITHPKEH